jgi:hypothetical protein
MSEGEIVTLKVHFQHMDFFSDDEKRAWERYIQKKAEKDGKFHSGCGNTRVRSRYAQLDFEWEETQL